MCMNYHFVTLHAYIYAPGFLLGQYVIFTPHRSHVKLSLVPRPPVKGLGVGRDYVKLNLMCVGLLLMVSWFWFWLAPHTFITVLLGFYFGLCCPENYKMLISLSWLSIVLALCFKCKVSMHGLVPLKAVWESHSAWEWGKWSHLFSSLHGSVSHN